MDNKEYVDTIIERAMNESNLAVEDMAVKDEDEDEDDLDDDDYDPIQFT